MLKSLKSEVGTVGGWSHDLIIFREMLAMQVYEAVLARFAAYMSIHKFDLSYYIETTTIDAYVGHLNDKK